MLIQIDTNTINERFGEPKEYLSVLKIPTAVFCIKQLKLGQIDLISRLYFEIRVDCLISFYKFRIIIKHWLLKDLIYPFTLQDFVKLQQNIFNLTYFLVRTRLKVFNAGSATTTTARVDSRLRLSKWGWGKYLFTWLLFPKNVTFIVISNFSFINKKLDIFKKVRIIVDFDCLQWHFV